MDFFSSITNPESIEFQTPETRPFCEAIAAATQRLQMLEIQYEKEQQTSTAARLVSLLKGQVQALEVILQSFKHLTAWQEKQIAYYRGEIQRASFN